MAAAESLTRVLLRLLKLLGVVQIKYVPMQKYGTKYVIVAVGFEMRYNTTQISLLAPRTGLEPVTSRLTVDCSTN